MRLVFYNLNLTQCSRYQSKDDTGGISWFQYNIWTKLIGILRRQEETKGLVTEYVSYQEGYAPGIQ